MKFLITFLAFLFIPVIPFAQKDEHTAKQERKNAYVIGFSPTRKENIYGLALGIIGSEVMCHDSIIKRSHGVHIQLTGQVFFIPLNRGFFSFERTLSTDSSALVNYPLAGSNRALHNGLLISGFGTTSHTVNGVSLSAIASMHGRMNGFSFNLLSSKIGRMNGVSVACNNQAHKVNGIQIGLVNKCVNLKGAQFGLWNVNSKRKLPFINWSFRI